MYKEAAVRMFKVVMQPGWDFEKLAHGPGSQCLAISR